ncbi:MAG: hypothetical protein ACJAYU_001854 [Bradymonadia bacterium]|jgi:hypothetical protein
MQNKFRIAALVVGFSLAACSDDSGNGDTTDANPDLANDTGLVDTGNDADAGQFDVEVSDPDVGPTPDVPIEDVDPTCEPADSPAIVEPIWIAGATGSRDELGRFGKPDAIFLTPSGILIAGDEDNEYDEVHLFDTRTDDPNLRADMIDPLVDWGADPGPGGDGEFEFRGVSGFAADPQTGRLYVVEQGNGRIQMLDPIGDATEAPYFEFVGFLGAFAADLDDPENGEFVRLQAARTDSLRRLFVSDDAKDNAESARRDIQVFDEEGEFLFRFGDESQGALGRDGNLDEPENFVIDEARNRIYVCDEGPENLVVYRYSDGEFLQRIEGFDGTPNGVDIDQFGYLYVVDEGSRDETFVRVFDPETLTQVFAFGGYSDRDDLAPGYFNSPDTLIIDIDQDVIIVADQGHDRIQAFRLSEVQALMCLRVLHTSGPERAVAGTTLTLRLELFGDDRVHAASFRQDGIATMSDANGFVEEYEIYTHNGTGSVTLPVEAPGDYSVELNIDGISTIHEFVVEANPATRTVEGELAGDDLEWDTDEVVHVTGPVRVAAGDTLTIAPGTLVMLDDTARLEVSGSVDALGTEAAPISFFAADPAEGWEQIDHTEGFGTARYHNVFFANGGDAFWERNDEFRHCCAYNIRSNGGTLEMVRTVIADSPGKAMLTFDTNLTIASALFNRLSSGVEVVRGVALITDTVIAEIRGPDDTDGLYLSNTPPGDVADFTVARIVVAGTDDDGIDTENSSPIIINATLYDIFDKGFALTGGSPIFTNVLVFNTRIGARMDDKFRTTPDRPEFINSTFVNNSSVGFYADDRGGLDADADVQTTFERSVVWGNGESFQTDWVLEDITANSCIVEGLTDEVSGSASIDEAPVFLAPSRNDFRLHPLSPRPSTGGQVGWQGFPVTN